MPVFPRFFRKAPQSIQSEDEPIAAAPLPPVPSVPDRVVLAAREENTLRTAMRDGDAATIAKLVVEGASTKIRQLAAQSVEDPATLRQLIREVRGGNDKTVYKILAAKRDAQLTEERKLERLRAEIDGVSSELERQALRPHSPQYRFTLEQLEHRWKAVAPDADAGVTERVQAALGRSREVITEHHRQIEAAAARQAAEVDAAAETRRQRELEREAASAAAAEKARIAEAERSAAAEKKEAQALALRDIGTLIRKAHGALNGGGTRRAAELRRALGEQAEGAAPLPGFLASQLQQLDAKLEELKDWKSFAVSPKKAELIAEMESLIGSTLKPPALAERIKGLREEWRTLSKGAGENAQSDWDRFQEAAQQAYQPCREYFEAQAALRQENLKRREALFDRLSAFEAGHNWEQPDWRTIAAALRESKRLWHEHSPVERSAARALQERFDAASAALQARLDAEHARNVKQQQILIDKAQRLSTSEDSRAAIDAVKDLQQQWKNVGPVAREADHGLWEEFRQHCDAIFQKRQLEFTQYTAELDANKAKAIAVCEEIEGIAALPGAEFLARAKHLPEQRGLFEGIGELPRDASRGMRARFERALSRCEKTLAELERRAVEDRWSYLFEAADHVRAYRSAIAHEADAAECARLRQAAEAFVSSIERWPRGGLETIKRQLQNEAASTLSGEATLRLLCVRAEIAANKPTPSSDLPLRQQYQMQRLVKNMGQGIAAGADELDDLAIEWVKAEPTEDSVYRQLVERFRACRPR